MNYRHMHGTESSINPGRRGEYYVSLISDRNKIRDRPGRVDCQVGFRMYTLFFGGGGTIYCNRPIMGRFRGEVLQGRQKQSRSRSAFIVSLAKRTCLGHFQVGSYC